MGVLLAQYVLSMRSVLRLLAALLLPFLFLLSLLEGSGKRQRGDSNPCGQSPMDFESISLAARTHCLDVKSPPKARSALCSAAPAAPLSHAAGSRGTRARVIHRLTLGLHTYFWRSDSEGIRTPAGRAQWISSPSP